MSTPPTQGSGHATGAPPGTPATAAARANSSAATAARQAGGGTDLFAGLLSLLSAAPALPAGADASDSASLLPPADAGDGGPGDGSADAQAQAGNGSPWGAGEHPLAALLAWSSTPSAWSSLPAPGGTAQGDANGQAADGGAASMAGGPWEATPFGMTGALSGSAGDSATGAAPGDPGALGSQGAAATAPAPAQNTGASGTTGAAPMVWQASPPSGSALPAGMTALPQALPLNADDAAALARQGAADAATRPQVEGAASGAESAATSAAAPRAGGAWRSTTTLARPGLAHSLPASPAGAASHAAGPATVLAAGVLPGAAGLVESGVGARSRSTVLLDERFAAGVGAPGPASAAGGELAAGGSGAGQTGGGQAGSDGRSGAGDGATPYAGNDSDAAALDSAPSDPGSEPATETDAALAAEQTAEQEAALAPNLPQSLRQASLRLGDGSDDAIDIRLSLAGEQLSVDFRTDDPNTRERLQDNADAALGELLQRSGLQLGGVSVGSQTLAQDGGRGQAPPNSARGVAQRTPAGASGTDPAASAPAAAPRPGPRSDGSHPLDLFV